ncbi:hypothetical protein [Tenacibaculum sp. 47A_GOM-205m]|uniref:hypothetical protein n=1 Tax=Tenacibaculum sp. 47A_GOM-205m TaxID=1380384 RepID=UPI00048C45F0|nr:hypothetical protein [Tenacibaculum sp. 47A_GOM-205m]
MNKLKRNTILILITYVVGIVIRSITFNFWDTNLDLIYQIGKYLGNTLMVISIIWSVLNAINLIRTKDIENGIIKFIWLFINLIPIIFLLFALIFQD